MSDSAQPWISHRNKSRLILAMAVFIGELAYLTWFI